MSIKITENEISELSKLVISREQELDFSRSQSDDVKQMKEDILNLFKKHKIEYCSHNLAILGSQRYKKYKFEGVDTLINKRQYNKLSAQESDNANQ